MSDKKRIVITGMGIASCLGNDVDTFYNNLLGGVSGIAPINSFPCEDYPTRFAGAIKDLDTEGYLDKKQARRVDPYISYSIVSGKKALEMAELDGDKLEGIDKKKCGILIGSGMGGMGVFSNGVEALINRGFKIGRAHV